MKGKREKEEKEEKEGYRKEVMGDTYHCSAPWPVLRSCKSSTTGTPWDSAARRKSSLIGYALCHEISPDYHADNKNRIAY
jgi:hypothetical protein